MPDTTIDSHGRRQALQRQTTRLEQRLTKLEKLSSRYVSARFTDFVLSAGICAAAFIYVNLWAGLIVTTIATIAFGVLVYFHRQVQTSIARHRLWLKRTKTQLARIELDWANIPDKIVVNRSPLEVDFDLTGIQSVHQLVDTAVSRGGSQRLRHWLSNGEPEYAQILPRQKLVRELLPDVLFRGKLDMYARLAAEKAKAGQWSTSELTEWLQRHEDGQNLRPLLIALFSLAAVNILLLILNLLGIIGAWWQVTLIAYVILSLGQAQQIGTTFQQAASLRDRIERLTAVFQQLENHHYRRQPNLRALCRPFADAADKPSHFLGRVGRVVSATSLRGNPPLWLILNLIGPWDYYFAYRLQQVKKEIAQRLPAWLDVWFEVEAVSSLANFAYLHPDYTFPALTQDDDQPLFAAEQLGHPLIPEAVRVCNDFAIEQRPFLGILTGSNMAGKSSFLRTVGINVLLAYAGGVVNAQAMTVRPLRLFSCIRVTDSVIDGISYFYAEVKRLRSLLDELQREDERPLFFFIDEIFRGTNNRERLQGSRAYLRAVAKENGIGLISTHDLELVSLTDEIPQAANYHFREDVRDGRMVFDYTLRAGPSPTTNALRIMALEGLPIGEGEFENETV